MQWIDPAVLARCALPGETDAVVKLHGYPLNLTKEIVGAMRRDIKSQGLTANDR
jgi:hypothetical protein